MLGKRRDIGRQRQDGNAKCPASALGDGQDALKILVPCDKMWPVVMGTAPGHLSPDATRPRDHGSARRCLGHTFNHFGGTPGRGWQALLRQRTWRWDFHNQRPTPHTASPIRVFNLRGAMVYIDVLRQNLKLSLSFHFLHMAEQPRIGRSSR